MALLEVKDIKYGPQKNICLLARELSFNIEPGEKIVVSGPNGVGKSTLLRVLLGLIKPLSGQVKINIEREKIAYLPQLQNTAFHIPVTLADVLNISSKKNINAQDVETVGLLKADDLGKGWNTASGGERQKTLLTRALLSDAVLLIFDEPMNHLDAQAKNIVRNFILDFSCQENGRSVLMVCHNEESHFSALDNLDFRHITLSEWL